jgi:hypothetical protein
VEPDTCSARATLQNDLRAAGSCRDPRCVQRARGQPRPGGRAVPVDRFGPDRRRSRSYVQAAKAPAGTLPPRGLFARAPGPSGELGASGGSCRQGPVSLDGSAEAHALARYHMVAAGHVAVAQKQVGLSDPRARVAGGVGGVLRPPAGGGGVTTTTERFVCCAVRSVCAGGGRRALWLHNRRQGIRPRATARFPPACVVCYRAAWVMA